MWAKKSEWRNSESWNWRGPGRLNSNSIILTCKLLGFTEVFKQENGKVDFSATITLVAKAEEKKKWVC